MCSTRKTPHNRRPAKKSLLGAADVVAAGAAAAGAVSDAAGVVAGAAAVEAAQVAACPGASAAGVRLKTLNRRSRSGSQGRVLLDPAQLFLFAPNHRRCP